MRPIRSLRGRELRRRALLAGRDPRRLRGRTGGRAGARHQSGLPIIARAHSEEEIEHLKRHGATKVIMGEYLIAKAMIADRA